MSGHKLDDRSANRAESRHRLLASGRAVISLHIPVTTFLACVRFSDIMNKIRTTDIVYEARSCHAGCTRRDTQRAWYYLGKALSPVGSTIAHDGISPETQHADLHHEPHSARQAERARLGLLGRIAAVVCLIEIYGHAPNAEEFRGCLAKHIAFWQQRTRKTRAHNKQRRLKRRLPKAFVEPSLWIIAAGAPRAILTKLELKPAHGWPAGVYFFGDDVLRVGIVVASELPRDPSTLLVRLMAAGPLLPQAIEDLRALPRTRTSVSWPSRSCYSCSTRSEHKPRRTPKEQEFIVVMHKTWEDARTQGRVETRADAVLTVLRVRGIAVPDAARKRILAQKDLQRLERWHEKAIVATSLSEVLDDRAEDHSPKTSRPAAHKERSGRRPARAPAQR